LALEAEARPLIARFRLKRNLSVTAFRLYQNPQAGICLVVSGIGKVRMAAAVGLLAAYASPTCWIDVGTAGHPDLTVGTVRLAHKIVDHDTGRAFYPQLLMDVPVATEALITVSRPLAGFPDPALYDMEASGCFEAARHFVTIEWIHALKVVSDNREAAFDKKRAGPLVETALPVLESVVAGLRALHGSLIEPLPLDVARIAAETRLTQTQTRQLEKLLRRWQALSPETLPPEGDLCRMDRQTLLPWLRRRLHD